MASPVQMEVLVTIQHSFIHRLGQCSLTLSLLLAGACTLELPSAEEEPEDSFEDTFVEGVPGTLREPTGPWAVGARSFTIETERPEIFTSIEDDVRELAVTIVYPSPVEDAASPESRWPWIVAAEFPAGTIDHLTHVRTHATEGASVAGEGDLPVIVYNPGAHAYRQWGSFAVEELASRGYVVVCLEHPGNNLPTDLDPVVWDSLRQPVSSLMPGDEGFEDFLWESEAYNEEVQLPVWIEDNVDLARWLLEKQAQEGDDELFGRLDLERVGAFGWSLGGSTSVNLPAAFEGEAGLPEVVAVASLDGLTRGPVTELGTGEAAALFMHAGDAWDEPSGPAAGLMAKQQADLQHIAGLASGPMFDLTYTGNADLGVGPAEHGDFADLPRLTEDALAFQVTDLEHHSMARLLDAFFSSHLDDAGGSFDAAIEADPLTTNTQP